MDKQLRVDAPAKVNLTLDIIGKRHDGYHTLRTIMQTVTVFDTITLTPDPETTQIVLTAESEDDKIAVPCDETNLVWRAIDAFFSHTGITRIGMHAHIEKRIPAMAGLGGGSTDAAATLCAMNCLFDAGLDEDALCDIAITLGADVPFCVRGATALCEGIGDLLTPLPELADCYFLIVKPDFGISTPQAYQSYDALENPPVSNFDDMFAALAVASLEQTAANLFNALELACENEQITLIKQTMLENGALGALMTGSGSAVFGMFDGKKAAKRCAELFDDPAYPFVAVCKPHRGGADFD
ncbi:MAG: 4-(cytidine 5'-diphospho)-2-C-methyl-D-erythritol kinase [Oscillospiraceae bacterium]